MLTIEFKWQETFQILSNDDMAVMDITAQNVKKMLSDAKNMYELGISDIDCILEVLQYLLEMLSQVDNEAGGI